MLPKRVTKRETAATVRELGKNREIIVYIEPSGRIGFRPKGLRRTEYLTTDVCWEMAVKARVKAEDKEKGKKRKKKR